MRTEAELRSWWPSALRPVQAVRGGLRLNRPATLDADSTQHLGRLMDENEGVRRLVRNRVERERMFGEIHTEKATTRRTGLAVALFALRSVMEYVDEWRWQVSAWRRDVTRSPEFASALYKVSPDGMINLATYRLQQRAILSKAPVALLMSTHLDALDRGDASALEDERIIEGLVDAGVKPTNAEELATLKRLRELIELSRDLRVPSDLPAFEALAADVSRLQARANLLQVAPMNPDRDLAAARVYSSLEAHFLEAGAGTDAEDLEIAVKDAGRQTVGA